MKQNKQAAPAPTKSQHTPGPWKLAQVQVWDEIQQDHRQDGLGIVSDDNTILCRLDPWFSTAEPQMEANARLIASAPELLEALKDTLRYLVTPAGLPDKGKGRTEQQQAALAKAYAAIAKASQ